MPTIQLETKKSVVSFDLAELPRQAFIEFQGEYYARSGDRPLWKPVEGAPPAAASIAHLSIDGTIRVSGEDQAPPVTRDHHVPLASPATTPPATDHAEPDHG